MAIKVMLADDHRLIRDGLKNLIQSEDILIVAEAENGKEVMDLLPNVDVDVLVMDVTMPLLNGIEATTRLKDLPDAPAIVILSMHEEPEYILACVQAGADSYLLKNVEREELVQAIKLVHKGQKYFNAHISTLMAQALSSRKRETKVEMELTEREIEVLHCVAEGLSTKQMADRLSISTRTVETHRLHLLKKFDAQNAAEMIKMALERKIINI